MLQKFINALTNFFMPTQEHNSLEAFIIAGNPTSAHDVDMLEQEFYRRRSENSIAYFPNGSPHR